MSLDKSTIPKLSEFIPEKQRKAMSDHFVESIARTRTDKGKKVSGEIVETRSQKFSDGQKGMLEVEVHPEPAMDENRDGHGLEGRGNRILASESTPVDQGQSTPVVQKWLELIGYQKPNFLDLSKNETLQNKIIF